jgi:uncharacterized protein YbjQ (UPF0145 family)
MHIITLNTLDDRKYKPLGLVRGTIVHSVSFFRDILGNITGLIGGKNSAINQKIDDVYAEAIIELEKYTNKKYPSATYGRNRYHTESCAESSFKIAPNAPN